MMISPNKLIGSAVFRTMEALKGNTAFIEGGTAVRILAQLF